MKLSAALGLISEYSPGAIREIRQVEMDDRVALARKVAYRHLRLYDAWMELASWWIGDERVCACGSAVGDKWERRCMTCDQIELDVRREMARQDDDEV